LHFGGRSEDGPAARSLVELDSHLARLDVSPNGVKRDATSLSLEQQRCVGGAGYTQAAGNCVENVVGLLLAQMSNSDYRDFPGMRDFLKRTNCFVVKRVHPFAAIAIFRRSDFFKDVDDGEARR
jgi:hypothetical protein